MWCLGPSRHPYGADAHPPSGPAAAVHQSVKLASVEQQSSHLDAAEREPDAVELARGLEVADGPHRHAEVVGRCLDVEEPGRG